MVLSISSTAPLRVVSTTALFLGALAAFLALTVVLMFLTAAFSDHLSLFFFDLPGHVFPVACPDAMDNGTCRVWARGWNANWSYLVWGLVAVAYGIVARGRPLRQKTIIAFVAIIAVILVMELGMDLAGYYAFLDWI